MATAPSPTTRTSSRRCASRGDCSSAFLVAGATTERPTVQPLREPVMKSNAHRTMKPMAGFTLIEALIGLLVLAFGMLAIAAFQTSLTRSGDVSKQRTEATRLAQE